MTNQSTIDKLIEMRLTAMADAFRIQMDDPAMKEVPFEDRFGMLVDVEYSNRKNNRLKRLIRQAEFEQPDASIAAIDYHSGRKLNKALINRLATCEYITEYRNIFITGATGSGNQSLQCWHLAVQTQPGGSAFSDDCFYGCYTRHQQAYRSDLRMELPSLQDHPSGCGMHLP